MENDNDGPVAVRDYPVGCIPAPRRAQNARVGATRVGGREEEEESPHVSLRSDFHSLDSRAQFKERRRLYEGLREHYLRVKQRGGDIPRPDLAAMKQMNNEGLSLIFKELGDVPGVIVGDTFNYRSEMFVVGLHRRVQDGIAYINQDGEKIASSIVASGGYEDDVDLGEILEYSGQGGNDYKGEKRQVGDQKPSQGNEALMNSYHRQEPVRVIRGHDEETTWNKIYSYDGLYSVLNAVVDVGASGHKVYKFKLRRLPNQPALKIKTVQFNRPHLN